MTFELATLGLVSSGLPGHPFTPSLSGLFWSPSDSHYACLSSGDPHGEAPQPDFQGDCWVMSMSIQKQGQRGDDKYKDLLLPEHTNLHCCNSVPHWCRAICMLASSQHPK